MHAYLLHGAHDLRFEERPTPTPRASAAPVPSGVKTYTVKAGDTLGAIAARFGTTATELAKLNGITDPGYIRVGQVLRLP